MARVPPNLDNLMNEGIAFVIDRYKHEIPDCPVGKRPVMIGRRKPSYDTIDKVMKLLQVRCGLLKAGCEAFQREFERQAGFNSMAKCITIASACNLYWRKHHLTPNTIAVEPLGGWRGAKVNQSLKALQWLYYQEHQIPKQGASADRIRHVHNGGEQSFRTIVDAYFVDGYDPLICTVYEFHGCLYHGCPRCYSSRRAKHYAVPERSVEELYQATLCKRMALLPAGYTVIEMWECEWDRLVDNEPAVSHFLRSFDLVAPLEPREAFFGVEQAPWPCMLWLGRVRKYPMWM